MIEVKRTYQYHYDANGRGKDVNIERVADGIAYATSGSHADLGPFAMTFNASNGEGTGMYEGAYLVPVAQ